MNQELRDLKTMGEIDTIPKKESIGYDCIHPLNMSEANRLVRACKAGRERRLTILFLETGIHVAVLRNPTKYALKLIDGRILAWRRTKTNKPCKWEVPGFFQEDMLAILDNDLELKKGTYWSIVKRVGKRCGLNRASPLCLRHTCTIFAIENNDYDKIRHTINASRDVILRHYGLL